jgi:NAD+ diphosphatase
MMHKDVRMSRAAATGVPPRASTHIAFTGCRIDRAEHLRNDCERLAALWPAARVLSLDRNADVGTNAERDGLALQRGDAFAEGALDAALFLGIDDDGAWFAHRADTLAHALDLRGAAARLPAFEAGLFAYARALLLWRQRTRYCTHCAAPLRMTHSGHIARCDGCESDHYPRIDAAVIMLVSDGKRLLLGRQASWPQGRYSLLAGFVEPGERLEDTVAREVMEEAGVRVLHADYVASQPWPFPSGLMLGFSALAEPDPPRCNDELEDARWFTREELLAEVAGGRLGLSRPESISRWLIDRWLDGSA